jgi:Fic family protein
MKALQSLPSFCEMSDLDKIINYLFVRREAVQSSRLEGTWSTIDHALTPGDLVDAQRGKSEHIAVRGYAKALEGLYEEAFEKKEKIFTSKNIQKLHSEIVTSDPMSKGVPGKLRTPGHPGSVVTIGGGLRKENSIYNPVPPELVKRCLSEYLAWLGNTEFAQRGDAGQGFTLPLRLAIGHSHFEAVHPFTDGNGRTGRAIWPLQMICAGHMPLYLSGYVELNKDDYSRALQAAQKQLDYVPMIAFVCEAIIESDIELRKSREGLLALRAAWMARGQFRKGSAAMRALDILMSHPIITTETLEIKLRVSTPASARAIKQLVAAKIIRFREVENRTKVYAAEELIQILARPFGSDIDLALEKAMNLMKGKA